MHYYWFADIQQECGLLSLCEGGQWMSMSVLILYNIKTK